MICFVKSIVDNGLAHLYCTGLNKYQVKIDLNHAILDEFVFASNLFKAVKDAHEKHGASI